jgi:hypothetical protein
MEIISMDMAQILFLILAHYSMIQIKILVEELSSLIYYIFESKNLLLKNSTQPILSHFHPTKLNYY